MAMERVQGLLQQKQGFNPLIDERMLRMDGSEFVAETASAYVEHEGKPAVLVVLRDVSDRVEARKALQQNAETIRAVARNLTGVVFQFGVLPDGSLYFPFISESVERFLGVSAQEAMRDAQSVFACVHPDAIKGFMQKVETSIAQEALFAWQGRFVSRDGKLIWFDISAEPQPLAEGVVVWNGVAVDGTTQHQLEEQFRQAQKMESVGTLVGGIAHDFNNMLAGMLGQLYLVRHALQEGELDAAHVGKMVERINAVDKQGRLAADVITQLMTFARKGKVVMDRLDVNRLVADTMRLHRVSIPENITIRGHLSDTLEVEGDTGMIQQMMLNLLTNARDALDGKADPHIDI
ncbi:MAG: PAS domain-containing protein, partial [Mariprofundaceae bacterium]|nr:PAS domain-containing protein [Mariprofundaceae bacterium]